jgi:hypothetical protein
MLLQTNSYIVPPDKRAEHARLLRRFRQVLARLGCDSFEVYEQVGSNWNTAEISGRVVQIMRFRDRRHQLAVQAAERNDPVAQAVIAEFCNLINFPYQQQQGLFAVGFYNAVIPAATPRGHAEKDAHEAGEANKAAAAVPAADVAPLAASTVDVPDSEAVDADAAVDAAPNAPALHAEEPVFAEGTEGIIAAAEQLSDDQLDAGGDAAVASAIAGPSAAPAPAPEPTSNGTGEQSDEATLEVMRPDPSQVESAPAEPPRAEAEHPEPLQPDQSQPLQSHAELGPAEDLDLSSLLDPYLEHDNGDTNGHAEAEGNCAAPHAWRDSPSLDEVRGHVHEDSVPLKDVALEGGPEHDRNHVSQ